MEILEKIKIMLSVLGNRILQDISKRHSDGKIVVRILRALIETVILDVIVFSIFFLAISNKESFLSMNIHPFVLVSVLVGLTYGNYIGLFSALLQSVFFFLAYVMLSKDIYLFFTEFKYYKFILMFFLTAIVAGRIRDKYEDKMLILKEELKDLSDKYMMLEESATKQKFIKDELSKQIINSESSILSLYEMASSLENFESEEIYTELMGVVKKFLNADTVAFYTMNKYGSFLRLKVRYGENGILPNSVEVAKYPEIKDCVNSKSVGRRTANTTLEIPFLFAPICANGNVVGLLAVEHIEFMEITEYTFQTFKLIVDWTAKAIERAYSWNMAAEGKIIKNIFFEGTTTMTNDEFERRVAQEKRRKDKYGMHYILLKYRIENRDIFAFDKLARSAVREVDVFTFNAETGEFQVLLPATDEVYREQVVERIQAKFNYELETIE